MWKLRSLQAESGTSPDDLLVEITAITFATTTSCSLPTKFADGNIIAVIPCKRSASAVLYSSTKAVSDGEITITSSVTNCAETIDVVVIGRLEI